MRLSFKADTIAGLFAAGRVGSMAQRRVCIAAVVEEDLMRHCFFLESRTKKQTNITKNGTKKVPQILTKFIFSSRGGHPLNTRSGVNDGFGPEIYFYMFYKRFPRSFGTSLRDP